MSGVKDILRTINKNRSEVEKVKLASEKSFNVERVSTGSAYLDHKTKGGYGLGTMTMLTGWEGSGKSSMALIMLKEAMDKYPDKYAIYLDGERTLTDDYIDRFGIDRERFIGRQLSNLEEMLDLAQLFTTAEDVCIVVIDSVKSFFSTVVEEKSAEDITMGVEARKLNARMPIISSNCSDRNIGLVVINQWRENPGAYGDPKVLPGGNWNKYLPSFHLDFTKKDFIKDPSTGDIIGHVIDTRVRKSKFSPHDPREIISLNFYYTGGFNEIDENVQIALEQGEFIKKSGAWFSFPSRDGEEIKVQGKEAVIKHYKENPEDYEFLKQNNNSKIY